MTQDSGTAAEAGRVYVDRRGSVLHLVLDRPRARNALTAPMVETLIDELTSAAIDDTLRAVHISGSGSNFCGGADWVATNSAGRERPRSGDLVRRIPHAAHRVVELVHDIHLPVICSVRGWAVGLGCNLALAADFTVAADDAVFWEPFLTRGFSPDSGSTWLLPRLIGLARTRRMLLLGEKVGAAQAQDWGLIHRAVPTADLDTASGDLVARLASGPTVAIGFAKEAIRRNHSAVLADAMDTELHGLELSCRTADFKEGLAAFRDRRDPEFCGH
ncbi:enoyl-CoA hydratase-related protein [Gordonia sp. CPCC 206044]|uniref:enoyl-CoA hydratase/isomerase family protein n=1 Tax=Gordonia sp. CPCC 206044 TaxID=3140793 RepID=UPI003AF3D47F